MCNLSDGIFEKGTEQGIKKAKKGNRFQYVKRPFA